MKAAISGVSEQLAKDIETLDSLDAEIESLLKKRQNGYFSESDQIRLQELIDTREAIEIKYNLTPADTDGFEGIAQKVEAEVARAQARGQSDADVSVYENAVKAAAEGMAAVNAELDAQYDKEYAVIQLIKDSAERQSALDALNTRYNEEPPRRRAGVCADAGRRRHARVGVGRHTAGQSAGRYAADQTARVQHGWRGRQAPNS